MTDRNRFVLVDPDAWEKRDGRISDWIGYGAVVGCFALGFAVVTGLWWVM